MCGQKGEQQAMQNFLSPAIQSNAYLKMHEKFRNINQLKATRIGKIFQRIILNSVNRRFEEQAENTVPELTSDTSSDSNENYLVTQPTEVFLLPQIQRVKKLPHLTEDDTIILIKRIDHVTGLLSRIVVFDTYLISKASIPIENWVAWKMDPNCEKPNKLLELETQFSNCIGVLVNDDNAGFDALNEFVLSIRKILDFLDLLASNMQYNNYVFADPVLFSQESLTVQELYAYLPKLWTIIRLNNVLLKQWTASFLEYTLTHLCSRNDVTKFITIDLKLSEIKHRFTDVHHPANKLLTRWGRTNCPEVMDLYLVIAAANTASCLYNELINEIFMTKCYQGSRKISPS